MLRSAVCLASAVSGVPLPKSGAQAYLCSISPKLILLVPLLIGALLLYRRQARQAKAQAIPLLTHEQWLEKLPVTAVLPSTGNLVEFELDGLELIGDGDAVMASALLTEGFTNAGLVG